LPELSLKSAEVPNIWFCGKEHRIKIIIMHNLLRTSGSIFKLTLGEPSLWIICHSNSVASLTISTVKTTIYARLNNYA
jgi:hypothetical protein